MIGNPMSPYATERMRHLRCTQVVIWPEMYLSMVLFFHHVSVHWSTPFRLTTQCSKMSFFLIDIADTHCDFF